MAATSQSFADFDSLPLVSLDDAEASHVLAPGEYAWFHDPSGTVDFSHARAFFAGNTEKNDPWSGKYGYLEGTIWLGFRVNLPAGRDELVLAETYGIDHARFFIHDLGRNGGGIGDSWTWLQAESGWADKLSGRALPLRHSNVKFSLVPYPESRQVICLVALDSNTSLALGIELGTSQAFLVSQQPILGLVGGFVAAMVIFMIICIVFAWRYKNMLFINLAVYMLLASLMVLYNLGFANWLIWPGFPQLGRICATWCWGVACMLNVLFILSHLDLKNKNRGAYIASLAYLGVWALFSLLYLLFDERTAYRVSTQFSLSFPVFYLFYIVLAFRMKREHAWYLAIFWVFLTAGILVIFLRNLGIIPEGNYIYLSIFASLAGQCLCFILPLYLECRNAAIRSLQAGQGGGESVLPPTAAAGQEEGEGKLFRD